jgi:hypothetical protein
MDDERINLDEITTEVLCQLKISGVEIDPSPQYSLNISDEYSLVFII